MYIHMILAHHAGHIMDFYRSILQALRDPLGDCKVYVRSMICLTFAVAGTVAGVYFGLSPLPVIVANEGLARDSLLKM